MKYREPDVDCMCSSMYFSASMHVYMCVCVYVQLNAEREEVQKREQETESIRHKMHGFVSAEKEKFERLAHHMRSQEKDLAIKKQKLQQVEQIIKNSPRPLGSLGPGASRTASTAAAAAASTRAALRDRNNGSLSAEETVSVSGGVLQYNMVIWGAI